jgi:hypothetical protein
LSGHIAISIAGFRRAIKIGYIDRDRGTWLFSRQFQAVPFVF